MNVFLNIALIPHMEDNGQLYLHKESALEYLVTLT